MGSIPLPMVNGLFYFELVPPRYGCVRMVTDDQQKSDTVLPVMVRSYGSTETGVVVGGGAKRPKR